MKKFIRLLGFALLLVLIAFVGLIAYSVNFDPNAVLSYFMTIGISVLGPLLNFSQPTLIFGLTLGVTILYLILTIFLFILLITKFKFIRAFMTLFGLIATLSFALLSINGYFPDATSLENLGNQSNFVEILLIPVQNPSPGLWASAFSGLVASIVFFTLMFVIMSIIDLFRHPFIKQSSQVIPLVKEETVIAQELSKFVIPSQIRLPQTEVPLPVNPNQSFNALMPIETSTLSEQTPIVVLPPTPVLPEKQDIVKARQTVLQMKERIRAQIRLHLLEAKQLVLNASNKSITPISTPTGISQKSDENLNAQAPIIESQFNEMSQAQIQEKVNQAIATEIAQLEPRTKDQVNTLINEELIKYDSLNREVMESLVSEKIEQIISTNFDQFKQEMEAMISKSIQDFQTNQKQFEQTQTPTITKENDIKDQVERILLQSPLAKKVDNLEQSIQQVQHIDASNAISPLKVSDLETLIQNQTVTFVPLLERVSLLQQQVEQLTQGFDNFEKTPFVKQEIFDNQVELLKQTQQRLIQLQQDLISSKGTLDQFQIETLSRTNSMQEKVSSLEIKQLEKGQTAEGIDENVFISLLKKHQSILQPDLPLNVIQGLIANEIKKQVVQTPTLSKDEVKRMIEEAIKALPSSKMVTPEVDENKIADRVQAKLPKTLTESDVQKIIGSTNPTQPTLNEGLVLGLIANEIKKQVVQTPTLSKDEVKRMIEEAIKALPSSKVTTPEIDENKIADRVQAKLPKILTESDVQKIIGSTNPNQPTLNEGLVLGLISNEIKKQVVQTPTLSKDEVKRMIEEAISKVSMPISTTAKATVIQSDQYSTPTTSIPSEVVVPVIKKKNARAPENEKRAEQFKSVMTTDIGVTRTGKKKIVRIPFQERMAKADPMMLGHYDELKNYILSYQVKSRISNTGDMFRLHKEEFVKITIAGKSLKLYLALNPEDYKDSPIPVDDASDKKIYQQIPLVFKVKSDLSLKRAKKLVDDLMAKKSLPQKEIPFLPWSKAFIK